MESKKNKGFEIKVPGSNFVIKSNTIYRVKPKVDNNAPDGFRNQGTTKVIHPAVSDTVTAPFDIAMGVWDTGFFTDSPCLRGMKPEEQLNHVKNVTKHIVEPVEKIKGKGTLNHLANNDFFDKYVITLANKMIFNTAEPLQLLSLYLAVVGKQLTPSTEVGNRTYKHSAFQVINREQEVSTKEQSTLDSMKAMGEFYSLLQNNKEKLSKIFKYLKISNTLIKDEGTFMTVFNRYIEDREDGYRNGKIFLDTLERFSGEGEAELNVFSDLNTLYDKGIIKINRKQFYYKDINLGNTLKEAASKVMAETELRKTILEVVADLEAENDQ